MIQIDDAGSGSLIGGTGIGILNATTNDYYFEIIPLKYYQTELFHNKVYQDYVNIIIKKGFRKLNISTNHLIEICPSYMFDKLRINLTEAGFNWKTAKIEGLLQKKIEESFENYVISLGLPPNFVKHARYAFGFHRLLKWVFADFENRKKLCKTQWKSWKKWCDVDKSIYHNILTYPDYCLKCGNKLIPNSPVTTIEYQTIKPATINLHKNCFSGKLNEYPPSILHEFKIKIDFNSQFNTEKNLKQLEPLFLKIIKNKINVLNSKGSILGYINDKLEAKLLIWINKGFCWNTYLIDYNKKSFILAGSLKQ